MRIPVSVEIDTNTRGTFVLEAIFPPETICCLSEEEALKEYVREKFRFLYILINVLTVWIGYREDIVVIAIDISLNIGIGGIV